MALTATIQPHERVCVLCAICSVTSQTFSSAGHTYSTFCSLLLLLNLNGQTPRVESAGVTRDIVIHRECPYTRRFSSPEGLWLPNLSIGGGHGKRSTRTGLVATIHNEDNVPVRAPQVRYEILFT